MVMDRNKIRTDVINSYLGYIIRSVIEHRDQVELDRVNKPEIEKNPEKGIAQDESKSRLLSTPGAVRYEDVQEYLLNKNKI
jgi:hypothetical protein